MTVELILPSYKRRPETEKLSQTERITIYRYLKNRFDWVGVANGERSGVVGGGSGVPAQQAFRMVRKGKTTPSDT